MQIFPILQSPNFISNKDSYQFITNVSSSTSHKKIRLYVREFKSVGVADQSLSKLNPSPNAFPKLCERFSARLPLKGRGTVPSFAL